MKPLLLSLCMAGCFFSGVSRASAPASVAPNVGAAVELSFAVFLNEVVATNLDYAAQRYNVSLAEAALTAAKVAPNPNLDVGWGRDITHGGRERLPGTFGAGLTQTIELGGKRKARRQVADYNLQTASATLESYLYNLRADAATAFVEALATQKAFEQKRRSAHSLDELVAANEQRLRVGDVGETDVTQSRVAALQFQSELLGAQAEAEAAQIALAGFLGPEKAQATIVPLGKLEQPPRAFDLAQLLTSSLARRADLLALRQARDAAHAGIQLAKAGRIPDVDVGVGIAHSTASENTIAPSPSFNTLELSFSIPLPLFNPHLAEIAAARISYHQAGRTLQATEQKAQIEIRQAYARYRLNVQRSARFQSATLAGADEVLAAKRFSYQRGQTTLLDLLEAQRSADDVYLSYYETLLETAKNLIELERVTQTWDVDF